MGRHNARTPGLSHHCCNASPRPEETPAECVCDRSLFCVSPRFECLLCFVRCFLQGSATLSMAYAAALFADSVLRGLNGGSVG
jgi:hypothetical protein